MIRVHTNRNGLAGWTVWDEGSDRSYGHNAMYSVQYKQGIRAYKEAKQEEEEALTVRSFWVSSVPNTSLATCDRRSEAASSNRRVDVLRAFNE